MSRIPRSDVHSGAAFLRTLTSPEKVQDFLDTLSYSEDTFYRNTYRIIRERKANCVDGALAAAAAFQMTGREPVVMELCAENDDDHFLALFRDGPMYGAVAFSNFAGLRYRAPVYRSIRELTMSYFENFFNTNRERTLRSRSVPVNLRRYDYLNWMTRDDGIETLTHLIEKRRHYELIPAALALMLPLVDERSSLAGLLGANAAGLFQPSRPALTDKRCALPVQR